MGKGAFWLGKGADTDSRQERMANIMSNRFEVPESYKEHHEDESKDSQQEEQYMAVKEEDGEKPRGSNMERVTGFGRRVAVKSEGKSEEIDDPRIHKMYGPKIQRMYREGLSENRGDSTDELTDSSEESRCEESMEAYEELVREFPELMGVVEEERKERERGHTERQLGKREMPGPILYNPVWNRGWGAAFKLKKRRVESSEREVDTSQEELKQQMGDAKTA